MWDTGLKLTKRGGEIVSRKGKLLIKFLVEDNDLPEAVVWLFLFRELQKVGKKIEDESP